MENMFAQESVTVEMNSCGLGSCSGTCDTYALRSTYTDADDRSNSFPCCLQYVPVETLSQSL